MELLEKIIFILLFVIGVCWGSFLGTIVYRLKLDKKGWTLNLGGYSKCNYCGHRLFVRDLIPILSFVALRGKCRYCKHPINLDLFLIEFFSGIIFILSFWAFYFSFSFFLSLAIWSLLLIIFFYDLKNQLIPDPLVFLLLGFFLLKFILKLDPSFYSFLNYKESLLGAILLFLFFFLLNYFSKGKLMGLGDAKFSLFFGLFLGFKYSFIFLWLSFVIGGLVAFLALVLKLKKRKDRIAFAPFLIFSFFLLYFFPHFRELFMVFFMIE